MRSRWLGDRPISTVDILVVGSAMVLWLGYEITPRPQWDWRVRQREVGKCSAAESQVEQLNSASQLFVVDNARAPQSLDELIHQPSHAKNWKKYLEDLNEVPKDPWGSEYVYRIPGPCGEPFQILSCGPDGKPGTKDDITSAAGHDDAKAGS